MDGDDNSRGSSRQVFGVSNIAKCFSAWPAVRGRSRKTVCAKIFVSVGGEMFLIKFRKPKFKMLFLVVLLNFFINVLFLCGNHGKKLAENKHWEQPRPQFTQRCLPLVFTIGVREDRAAAPPIFLEISLFGQKVSCHSGNDVSTVWWLDESIHP